MLWFGVQLSLHISLDLRGSAQSRHMAQKLDRHQVGNGISPLRTLTSPALRTRPGVGHHPRGTKPVRVRPGLTFAMGMQSQPATYALMLGLGASPGAGIKTGWGIVQDLVRRTARATGVSQEETNAGALCTAHHSHDVIAPS